MKLGMISGASPKAISVCSVCSHKHERRGGCRGALSYIRRTGEGYTSPRLYMLYNRGRGRGEPCQVVLNRQAWVEAPVGLTYTARTVIFVD